METAHYSGFGSTHTLALNTSTGFAYAVGTRTCEGGLHVVDVRTPASPRAAGCFSLDGYTHETQCVIYDGPDTLYRGHEICFNSNEDTLTIVDVTDKLEQAQLSRTGYGGSAYTHQGWLTEDQRFFLVNDEGDELAFRHPTRTWIWDVSDLDAPSAQQQPRPRHAIHRSQPVCPRASRLRIELPQRPARARRERHRPRPAARGRVFRRLSGRRSAVVQRRVDVLSVFCEWTGGDQRHRAGVVPRASSRGASRCAVRPPAHHRGPWQPRLHRSGLVCTS